MTATSIDVRHPDGRVLVAYDTGPSGAAALTLVWHHGSPQTGAPLDPLLEAAATRGIRLVSYGRPGYGGSTPLPGRSVASAADDVARIADALGIGRFAVMGASGGSPHALACAALLAGRVLGAVSIAGPAPFTRDERAPSPAPVDWYAGMVSPGGLRAAVAGRDARLRSAATEEFDGSSFIEADWAALRDRWQSLGADAGRAAAAGPDGLVDDDVAYVKPWGFELSDIGVPVLLVQGGEDRVIPRSHAEWLLAAIPTAQLWLRPNDGHVSVLDACGVAMDWLLAEIGAR